MHKIIYAPIAGPLAKGLLDGYVLIDDLLTASVATPSEGLKVPTGHSPGLPMPATQYRPVGHTWLTSQSVSP